jgi:hypothetical protein
MPDVAVRVSSDPGDLLDPSPALSCWAASNGSVVVSEISRLIKESERGNDKANAESGSGGAASATSNEA